MEQMEQMEKWEIYVVSMLYEWIFGYLMFSFRFVHKHQVFELTSIVPRHLSAACLAISIRFCFLI